MGIVSPIGIGIDRFWENAVAGVNGITGIQSFDASKQRSRVAGEVADLDPKTFLSAKQIEQTDRFAQLALHAANQAVQDAGSLTCYEPQRIAVSLGSGMGGFATFESSAVRKIQNKSLPPFSVPRIMTNSAAAWIATQYGFRGANLTCSTACSSGANAIGMALDLLRTGKADAVIAGGAEACVLPMTMSGFEALMALSTGFNNDPAHASRPFAKGRDGFVMSEGAGIVVLEEYEHAKNRGAKIYCELAGYGCTADAYHMTAPMPEGEGAARAMTIAMRHAKVTPDQVDYINAHATSTGLGDICETRAIKLALGDHARKVAVSATKSTTGHLLGAAGGVELAASALAIKYGVIPPTINLENPDPECDLDCVPNVAREAKLDCVMSNSFGFGGHNATILLKAVG